MAVEIERKFLVDMKSFDMPDEGLRIRQGFLSSDKERVVRVRTMGDEATITIKGITRGFSRVEYEYEIPMRDAEELLNNLCEKPLIEKTRYRIEYGKHIWDVDVFSGENMGLVVAEIELDSDDEEFGRPDWLAEEVTGDERYYNSNLARNPHKDWY